MFPNPALEHQELLTTCFSSKQASLNGIIFPKVDGHDGGVVQRTTNSDERNVTSLCVQKETRGIEDGCLCVLIRENVYHVLDLISSSVCFECFHNE